MSIRDGQGVQVGDRNTQTNARYARSGVQGQGLQVIINADSLLADEHERGSGSSAAVALGDRVGSAPGLVSNLARRNAGFVGRDAVLEQMRRLLREQGRVVTRPRARMGGVGKTQLAVEYGHRFADDYDVIWLVSAEQSELIGDRLAQAALAAGLIGPDVATSAAVQAVHAAVQTDRRWLLIFDNAEDPQALAPWLPSRGGHLIITSRNPGWDEIAAPVEVGLFDRSESVTLLQQRILQLPAAAADRLAEHLGDLPLAIAQAAIFMADTGIPTDDYLDHLNRHTTQLLENGRPGGYPTSLAASINLAADRLLQDSPAAAHLLNLCAVLAPEPIPLTVFTRSTALPPPLRTAASDWSAFYHLVKTIGDHGLADTSHQGIQVHRLIQAIVRERTDPQHLAITREQATAILVEAVPHDTDDPAIWPVWAALAPHLIAVDPATTDSTQLRTAGADLVLYLLRRADARSALHLAEQLHHHWRDRLGPDDVHTLKATTEYAHARHALGEIHQAHPIIEDTLARRRRVLGDDHPDTLRSANDLAVSLHALGEHTQARDMDQDTLARRRRVLGDDHPDTLASANSLAVSLNTLGEHTQARDMHQDTLTRRRRVLGDDHPDTLRSANDLAGSLHTLGEHAQARDMNQDTLTRRRRVLGDDHPDTLRSAHSLAGSLHTLGEHIQSRDMDQDTLARRRRVLGDDHPDTLASAYELARALYATGAIMPGRRMIDDVVKRMRQVLGQDHPDTKRARKTQAMIVGSMGGRTARQQGQPKRKNK